MAPTPSVRDMAGLATPMAIRVAATLKLVDYSQGAGATIAQLAAATGARASALGCLLGHLVTIGVFEVDNVGRYRPTALGAPLHTDHPDGIAPLLDMHCAGGRAELAFVELLGTITTGRPAHIARYGRDFWADLDTDPRLRRSFDEQMTWRFQHQAAQIATRFDWGRFPEILDVGGGDGLVLTAILQTHPGVRGRVLELAPAAAAAEERFAAAGFADRASAFTGSFFEPLPGGADAHLLCDILHDWDDEHARRILTGCRRAAEPGGTVVVIEPLRGGGADTAIDLFMLMCFGGRERTRDELTALAADSGLVLREGAIVSDERTALEFTPG